MALTRHQVTCSSKAGVGGIFFPTLYLALFCNMLFALRFQFCSMWLGNSKAATHVAVDVQCWTL